MVVRAQAVEAGWVQISALTFLLYGLYELFSLLGLSVCIWKMETNPLGLSRRVERPW